MSKAKEVLEFYEDRYKASDLPAEIRQCLKDVDAFYYIKGVSATSAKLYIGTRLTATLKRDDLKILIDEPKFLGVSVGSSGYIFVFKL